MKSLRTPSLGLLILLGAALAPADSLCAPSQALEQQNEILFQALQREHGLSDEQMSALRRIFANSGYIGQGNPAVTQHPVTPEQCTAKSAAAGGPHQNPPLPKIRPGKYKAPLYNPSRQKPEGSQARTRLDEIPA